MKHDVLTHSSFFEHMDEFGYLRDLEDILPEDFTSVFEIARVLEDPDSALFQKLAPAMSISRSAGRENKGPDDKWRPNYHVPNGAEYEAETIRSVSDIKRIFSHEFLLPDSVFMERLARRSLMMNVPRTPVIVGYDDAGREYAPNNFKQKVYVLIDTSTSMTSHHRFQMAKAVVYVFLKRNLHDLGHIYLRTFDIDIGPLQTATDEHGLHRLIHYAMRLGRLGNGTAMERALLQAADDIRARSALSGAEILLVTDGACHLDSDRIRQSLGDMIRINTIKIGEARIFPDEKHLRQTASRGSLPHQMELARLEEEIRRTKFDLENAAAEQDKRRIRAQLTSVEYRAEQLRGLLVDKLRAGYGREIEQLSQVFVNVDDISADALFALQQSQIDEIRELMREVEADFSDGADPDSFREAALLYEHVLMLLKNTTDPEQIRQLEEMADGLQEFLKDVANPLPSQHAGGISRGDIRDIRMMLRMKGPKGGAGISLLRVLAMLVRKTVLWVKRAFNKPNPPS